MTGPKERTWTDTGKDLLKEHPNYVAVATMAAAVPLMVITKGKIAPLLKTGLGIGVVFGGTNLASESLKAQDYDTDAANWQILALPGLHKSLEHKPSNTVFEVEDQGTVVHLMKKVTDGNGGVKLSENQTVEIYLVPANGGNTERDKVATDHKGNPIVFDSGLTRDDFKLLENQAKVRVEEQKANFDKKSSLKAALEHGGKLIGVEKPRLSNSTGNTLQDFGNSLARNMPTIAAIGGPVIGLLTMAISGFSAVGVVVGGLAIAGGVLYTNIKNGWDAATKADSTPAGGGNRDTQTTPAAAVTPPGPGAAPPAKGANDKAGDKAEAKESPPPAPNLGTVEKPEKAPKTPPRENPTDKKSSGPARMSAGR